MGSINTMWYLIALSSGLYLQCKTEYPHAIACDLSFKVLIRNRAVLGNLTLLGMTSISEK